MSTYAEVKKTTYVTTLFSSYRFQNFVLLTLIRAAGGVYDFQYLEDA